MASEFIVSQAEEALLGPDTSRLRIKDVDALQAKVQTLASKFL